MNCKNCNTELHKEDDYCRNCGGKVIRNRLTLKNLFEHLSETFFNYDNKLLRTFIQLFKNPEDVIAGYIKGVRKKYVNPISYIGVALTLSGIVFFIMKKSKNTINYDVFNQGINQNFMAKIQNFTTEYGSFLFLSYIPLLVIASWLSLKTINYNITERIVTFTYTMAQFSLIVFLPNLLFILFFFDFYMYYSYFAMTFLVFYLSWVVYKLIKLKGVELLGQLVIFQFFFWFLFMGLSLIMVIFLIITGEINFQDFRPK